MTIARIRIGQIKLKPQKMRTAKSMCVYWLRFDDAIENGERVVAVFSRFAVKGCTGLRLPPIGVFGRSE